MTKKTVRLPTEAVLQAARSAAQKLSTLSRDPEVRREAANVAAAVNRLLSAVRASGKSKPDL